MFKFRRETRAQLADVVRRLEALERLAPLAMDDHCTLATKVALIREDLKSLYQLVKLNAKAEPWTHKIFNRLRRTLSGTGSRLMPPPRT